MSDAQTHLILAAQVVLLMGQCFISFIVVGRLKAVAREFESVRRSLLGLSARLPDYQKDEDRPDTEVSREPV